MATYVNNLRLKEIATGDESGTWGTSTNTNLELIGEALGFGTEAITTNADTHTTTVADGSSDAGRAMYLKYTGTLDSACTITIGPNTMKRMQFIENGTSGSQNIVISQGSGANVTIPPTETKAVYLDGAGSGAAVVDAFANVNVGDLKVADDLTVTDDVSIGGALTLTGNGDFNGDLDVDGTTNLDVVDIDGAVDMASTLQVDGAITSSAGATITTADNLAQLTLISTDTDSSIGPIIDLKRNPNEAGADNDFIGQLFFTGHNDAGTPEDIIYAKLTSQIIDASDGTEDGNIVAFVMSGGSRKDMMRIGPTETVFNDASNDLDFRVESNGNANMLFVDGGNDKVGIGTASPATTLDIRTSDGTDAKLRLGSSSSIGLDVLGTIEFFSADPDDSGIKSSIHNLSTGNQGPGGSLSGNLVFSTTASDGGGNDSPSERMRIDSSGNILLNQTTSLIGGNTSDGSDNKSVMVNGGGNTSDSRGAYIWAKGNEFSGEGGFLRLNAGNVSGAAILLNTGGSEKVRLDSSGNVGIGTSSADQILHLKDSGDTYIVLEAGSSDGNGGILFHNSGGTEVGTMLFDTDDDYLRILVSQNQGTTFNAATASTWRALEIFQDRDATNTGSGIAFRSQSNTAPSGIVSVAGNTTGGIESLAFITSTGNQSAERMRITDAGLFGMGNSPTNLTTEILTITTPASGGGQGIAFKRLDTNTDQVCGQIRWSNNSTDDLAFIKTKTDGANTASAIQFFTNGGSGVAERARITKNGVFLLGATSVAGPGASVDSNTAEFGRGYINLDRDDTASIDQILFGKNGSIAGRITTTSSTTYTTTSDYRRKENITPVVNGLERVQKLNPVSYTWIDDEAKIVEEGFLAHEVQEAGWETGVGGEKDGEDVQSMDYGRITPLLVKAIQEQQQQIEQLKTEIEKIH